jgi:hypothetical protein
MMALVSSPRLCQALLDGWTRLQSTSAAPFVIHDELVELPNHLLSGFDVDELWWCREMRNEKVASVQWRID